ncbi:cellulase family glycosylhydrolase [Patescibacteria group bacterium]
MKNKCLKILAKIIIIILIFVAVYVNLAFFSYDNERQTHNGITFSKKFADYMGLNWQEAYLAMLDDLNVKYLRIPTYWDNIEPQQGQHNFADIDWQINEATKREAKVILVIGRRQPRWPECHDPAWVKTLPAEEQRAKILQNMGMIINRYKDNKTVEIWQVENEPFLDFFGECPKITKKELKEEIAFVRSIDDRPILITDSGELSIWYPAIKYGDLFGSTLYRITYNKYIGFWKYFFVPPSYYRVKAFMWGRDLQTAYIAELQAEPWFPIGPIDLPVEEHYETMNKDLLIKNAEYGQATNLGRVYFWGVEWWYWLKVKHGDDSLWQTAQQIFNGQK